jgi:hypothetical protein
MKRNYTLLLFLLATVSILAQTPEKMSYQVVLRDASNVLLTNQEVGMQISILQTTITGTAVYVETQTKSTNTNGLLSLEIGTGTSSDDFSAIDWSAGPYFIKTATDPSGGSSYSITGTSQLMSVPFAMYAKTSGSSTPGPKGEPGAQGTNGTPGIQGETGSAGVDGTNGTNGSNGAKGDQGVKGTAGADGAIGTAGADGATGTAGAAGTQGIQGETGTAGADGEKGDTGDQGTQGIQGETGSVGTNGTQGETGAQGIQGETGAAGTNATQPIYTINTLYPELGGYVIEINTDGTHGLVVAMQDQGTATWYEANDLLSDANNHDVNGAKFKDWRLPTKRELNLMYGVYIGGNGPNLNSYYWSSTEIDYNFVWLQSFYNGYHYDVNKYNTYGVRAVRAF